MLVIADDITGAAEMAGIAHCHGQQVRLLGSLCCDSVAAYCEELLQEAKVWLNPGTMYGPQSGEGYLRINLACPRSLLLEALRRIAATKA